jgi:DNA-binding ferritin-like protein (Dps family)
MLNINFILKYIDLTNKRKMSKIKKYIQFIKENNMFQYNDVIDYTLLEYTTTDDDIIDLCEKANMLGVKSVCVLPKHVTLASEKLKNSKKNYSKSKKVKKKKKMVTFLLCDF